MYPQKRKEIKLNVETRMGFLNATNTGGIFTDVAVYLTQNESLIYKRALACYSSPTEYVLDVVKSTTASLEKHMLGLQMSKQTNRNGKR